MSDSSSSPSEDEHVEYDSEWTGRDVSSKSGLESEAGARARGGLSAAAGTVSCAIAIGGEVRGRTKAKEWMNERNKDSTALQHYDKGVDEREVVA